MDMCGGEVDSGIGVIGEDYLLVVLYFLGYAAMAVVYLCSVMCCFYALIFKSV